MVCLEKCTIWPSEEIHCLIPSWHFPCGGPCRQFPNFEQDISKARVLGKESGGLSLKFTSNLISQPQKTNPIWFSSIFLQGLVFGAFPWGSSESNKHGGLQKQKVLMDARCHTTKQEESGPWQRQSMSLSLRLLLRKAPITPFILAALSQMTSRRFHFL